MLATVRKIVYPTRNSLALLRDRFGCDVTILPDAVAVLAWSPADGWAASPLRNAVHHDRLGSLVGFLDGIGGRLGSEPWWVLVCLDDGWREGTRPDQAATWASARRPAGGLAQGSMLTHLSVKRPRVLCFGRLVGDSSAELIPEPHWLYSRYYARTRLQLPFEDRRWGRKAMTAVYAGGRNGRSESFLDRSLELGPREHLSRLVAIQRLDVTVALGGGLSRRAQLRHRWVLDIDGFARTWDAWAWKQRSRSVVLSQTSVWESYFTQRFEPWRHYVPISNDLSDLCSVLTWCRDNDAEAYAIALRGRRLAREVYSPKAVRDDTCRVLECMAFDQ